MLLTCLPATSRLTGYCSRCSNNVYDGTAKSMAMDHLVYIIIFPWFGRVELCASRHAERHWNEDSRVATRISSYGYVENIAIITRLVSLCML
jgi:hypothetical protein